jgi:hypothetical protein
MKLRSLFLLAILCLPLLGLGACATVSTEAEEVSTAAKNFDPLEDKGVVFLYRRGRMVGAAGSIQVTVNGQPAGGLGPGTFFRWNVEPGTYTFLSSTGESSGTVVLTVEAGNVYFIEQTMRMGVDSGRVTMNERDAATGEPQVEGLNMAVSAWVPE